MYALYDFQDNIVLFIDDMDSMKETGYSFDEHEAVDGGHGRIETRRNVTTCDIDWLDDKENWPGLKSLGMVESTRNINGEVSFDRRYYISSLDGSAQVFGDSVRRHIRGGIS